MHSMKRSQFDQQAEDETVQIAGEIVEVKHTSTKRDSKSMAILTLVNGADEYRCTLFPGQYSKYKDSLKATAVIVRGKKNNWKDHPGVIVSHMMDIEEFIEDIK